MDTTEPEENANATTRPPLLTADGGAVAKQTQQANSQTQQNTDDIHQQEQSQIADPVEEHHMPLEDANNDDLYRMPGEIALERIEEDNLPKQEDRELFHTPVTAITQDEFVSIQNKTRRAYQDITRYMTSTKTVIRKYNTVKGDPPKKPRSSWRTYCPHTATSGMLGQHSHLKQRSSTSRKNICP